MQDKTSNMEPNPAVLSGDSPGHIARRLFLATRPMFLTASILPVVVGSAWGRAVAHGFDLWVALLALWATVCVHAASNVYNDVGDELNGTDRGNKTRIYPFTGGSRFIQNGVMTVREMRRFAFSLYAVAILAGLVLVAVRGPGVMIFGLIGIGLGMLYSLPHVQLSGRGIGEAMIAVAFGVLPVTGAAWLQTGIVDINAVLLSLPVSFWVAAILLINEVPDMGADAAAGKRTLPVRVGFRGTKWLYLGLQTAAGLAIGAMVWRELLPLYTLTLPFILLLGAVMTATGIERARRDMVVLKNGIKTTLAIHALGCLWLTGVIVLSV